MEVQRLKAHPQVLPAQGRIALRRGPLIYALEQADNPAPVREVVVPATAAIESRRDPSLAGGVVTLSMEGLAYPASKWDGRLYQPASTAPPQRVRLRAVPYAIWGNRGAGEMAVWVASN
jgi:DUF1680 family protein